LPGDVERCDEIENDTRPRGARFARLFVFDSEHESP